MREHNWKLAKDKFRTNIWKYFFTQSKNTSGGRNTGGTQDQAGYGAGYYLAFRQTKQ